MQFPRTGLVDVAHFGIWNAGLILISALCVATTALWILSSHGAMSIRAVVGGLSLVVFCMVCVWAERGRGPSRLQWTDGSWRLGSLGVGDERPLVRVEVVVDLGVWMLLRCEAEGHTSIHPVRWLALQRDGLRGDWHALRCALHAGQLPETPQIGDHSSLQ
jgi:hypothetical protein